MEAAEAQNWALLASLKAIFVVFSTASVPLGYHLIFYFALSLSREAHSQPINRMATNGNATAPLDHKNMARLQVVTSVVSAAQFLVRKTLL